MGDSARKMKKEMLNSYFELCLENIKQHYIHTFFFYGILNDCLELKGAYVIFILVSHHILSVPLVDCTEAFMGHRNVLMMCRGPGFLYVDMSRYSTP